MSETTITFEGKPLRARIGESVAATLAGHGVLSLRTTPSGAERGIFCGMGVCQECLVTIDGMPNQRACMTKVAGPLEVSRTPQSPVTPDRAPLPPVTIETVPTREAEIVIVGAGPAGLSAAIAAREAGAEVLVLDERSVPGGQYYKQVAVEGAAAPDTQHRAGATLIARAREAGVEIVSEAVVWGAFEPPLELAVSAGGGTLRVVPNRLVLATGAYERGRMVSGWTLPGVMTTGAAQTLWRTARRIPGKRVLIAGNGPLNLQLAYELMAGGAEIAALVEVGRGPALATAAHVAAMALHAPELLFEGLRYQTRVAGARVPILVQSQFVGVSRKGDSLVATIRDARGSTREVTANAVCIGYGFEPANELLRVLGVRHEMDARGYLSPTRTADGETSVAGVYAVGDCSGIGGARAALAEGTVVGLAAARSLGKPTDAAVEVAASRELRRHRAFQRALWSMYAAPRQTLAGLAPQTVVCRCEEVTAGAIAGAIEAGCKSIGDLKRTTRAGMGRCQGRYCGALLNTAMADALGGQTHEYSGSAPRVPVRPLEVASLARAGPA